jgi:hypothetical protein
MLDRGLPDRDIQYSKRISTGIETPSRERVDKESRVEGGQMRKNVKGERISEIIKVFNRLTHLEAMQKP